MTDDLKSRIPAAIIYAVIVVGGLLGGVKSTYALLLLIFTLSIFEFIKISRNAGKMAHYTPYAALIMVTGYVAFRYLDSSTISILLVINALYLIANAVYVACCSKVLFVNSFIFTNIVPYLLLPFVISIYMVKHYPDFNLLILYLFILLWVNDSGAYFVGKLFGKNKLHPKISPGKTWEGFFGGGLFTVISAYLISIYSMQYDLMSWLIIGVIVWIFGVIGDFSESAWKRYYSIKDSGTVMRGHGGILDRLDSFVYSIPIISFIAFFILYT